mgnify:CR=1 FL=1
MAQGTKHMKALTLTQPWATLVAIGAKRMETRSWQTKYRGPLAIHAAKGFSESARLLLYREPFVSCTEFEPPQGWGHFNLVPTGAIIAVVDLMDVIPTGNLGFGEQVFEPERSFGDFGHGRFAWVLQYVRLLPQPVPCKGALGLWTVPEGLIK